MSNRSGGYMLNGLIVMLERESFGSMTALSDDYRPLNISKIRPIQIRILK